MGLHKIFLNIIFIILIMGNTGSTQTDVACNGNAALCSRSYSNVTMIGTHDSAFVGILPTDNQLVSVTTQLDDGIRFLQAQTHVNNGVLEMCHTSCTELDAGPLTSQHKPFYNMNIFFANRVSFLVILQSLFNSFQILSRPTC